MSKRPSLVSNMKHLAEKAESAPEREGEGGRAPKRPTATSTLNFPVDLLERLRMGAVRRAGRRKSGRPNVSALVVEILERHGDEIDNA